MNNDFIEIPTIIDHDSELFNEWISSIFSEFFLSLKIESQIREWEIIQYRFGLKGKSVLTLEETGIIFDVSRERIRQVEKRGLAALTALINEGINEKRRIALNTDLYTKLLEFKESLILLGQIINEYTIVNHAIDFFSEINIDLPQLRLLLILFGYKSIRLESGIPEYRIAWAKAEIKTKRIENAIQACLNYLRDVSIAKPFDEIKISINKGKPVKSRYGDEEINLAIDLSYDIERLEDLTIQVKYERLQSMADKVYRIMHNTGDPIHVRQLAIILNKEAFKYGERSRINQHHVGSRLSIDPRFTSIGRSGEWILAEWEEYSTEFVLDLMEDSLHANGEPLSMEAIYDYVSARRTVEKQAITSYLSQDQRFIRIGTNLFALKDWGMASVSSSRSRPLTRVFSKTKLCEYIELVFEDKGTEEMYLTDLSYEISSLEPEVSYQSIYNSISNSPAILLRDEQEGKIKRKIAVFFPGYRSKLSKLDILSKDIPVLELIKNTARRILIDSPEYQLELVTIRDMVSQELHCPPASVYAAIARMDDVEKLRNESNQVICRLIHEVGNYDEQLSNLEDKKLVSEIERALNLVNIESIDLALFQLGKIFEYTLKRYMQEIKSKQIIPVNQQDLKKLFNMVQWAGKVGVITDETALHYLRIERNDRGHGAPPELDERQALLRNSPTLIQFYIDYIVLFEMRRAKLV